MRISGVNEHVESEVLSPTTTIFWEPTAGPTAGSIRFSCVRYLRMKADMTYIGAPKNEGEFVVTADELLGTMLPIMDPSGAVVGQLPAEVFVGALKGMFDQWYAAKVTGAP